MKFARLLPLILLSSLAFGTATVSGKLQNPDTTGAVPGFVQFDLQNCGGNAPTVAGATISPQQKFQLNADGTWSGVMARNDEISCNGSFTTWWHKSYFVNFRQVGPAMDYICSQTSCVFDGTGGLTPITVYPPPTPPAQPLTGAQSIACTFTAATTWTCLNTLNTASVIVGMYDGSGNQLVKGVGSGPTSVVAIVNSVTATFASPTSGTMYVVNAGNWTPSVSAPNNIIGNPTSAQSIGNQPLNLSGPLNATGTTTTITNLNGAVYLDGTKYANLAAALTAVPSGGTVRISAGTYTLSAAISPVSNIDIECDPNGLVILQASASLNPANGMIFFNGVNHSRISGCVLDGNRTNNANLFSLVQLASSSSIELDHLHFQNITGNGVFLVSGNTHIAITRNEIDHFGQALPSSTGCGIVSQPSAAATNNSISVLENRIHDGNLGLCVFPSTTTANVTSDWDISHNKFYLNVNDGLQIFSANASTNAPIRGFRVVDNEGWCNGWPANGTNRSANCTAFGNGFLQSGASSSPSGSGFDFNSPVMEQFTIAANRAHDNFFEGFDITPQVAGNVSCTDAGNSVCTVQSGDSFNTSWKTGQGIRINNLLFTISSVATASSLTLNQNTGVLTNVSYVGVGYARMTVSGNVAYHNGYGQPLSTSGQGFSNIGYGDNFNGNVTYDNWSYGMIDQIATFVKHTGDKAFNNCGGAGSCTTGFLCQACLRPQFEDIVTDDSRSSNLQPTGVFLDSLTSFGLVHSTALCNYSSCSNAIVNDAGTNDIVDSGRERGGASSGGAGNLCFDAGGGSGCIDYLGGGGSFTSKMPAANTTLAGLSVAETFLSAQGFNAVTNAIGLQIFNTTTTCTTGASVGATCTTAAITLPVAEGDTSYRANCTGKGLTNVPVVIATTNSSASQFTITIAALTAAAASFTSYDCVVGHN